MSDTQRILEEAAAWHAASAGDAMDWAGFTAWLEADSRHRAVYDEVALADSLVTDHRAALRGSEAAAASRRRPGRWKWAGGAIAAALALVLVVHGWMAQRFTTYETADTAREIALADGSSVTLAPHSRVVVSSDQREIAMSGGAWFDIRHLPGRELAITAGPLQLRDIGTKFDVQANPGLIRVGIADGRVEVASAALAKPLRLEAGKHMLFDESAGKVTLSNMPVAAVGSWRHGQLTYQSTPLPLVAADLSRYAGVRIELPASLKDRRFSGTLASSDAKAAIRDLAQLMALELVPAGGGYRLEPRAR
jgi:transmembrane sensor